MAEKTPDKTEKPHTDTVSDVRESIDREREERTAAETPLETCPVCKRQFKSLRHHIKYLANKGDVPHQEFKEAQEKPEAEEVTEHFSPGAGDALVGVLLSVILQKRPDVVIPEGWRLRAADAHQKVLERHIGPLLEEKSDLVYLGLVWAELYGVNAAVPALAAAEVPSAVPPDVKEVSAEK